MTWRSDRGSGEEGREEELPSHERGRSRVSESPSVESLSVVPSAEQASTIISEQSTVRLVVVSRLPVVRFHRSHLSQDASSGGACQ